MANQNNLNTRAYILELASKNFSTARCNFSTFWKSQIYFHEIFAPFQGEHNYLTVEEMAAEINGYDQGSISHLYLTSDGGMNLPTLYKMVQMLENHVKVVNHEELTEMARQKSKSTQIE